MCIFVCKLHLHFPDSKYSEIFFVIRKFLAYTPPPPPPPPQLYMLATTLNIPYEERICSHCDLNEVGNEQHYLKQCANTKFSVIRTNFITNLFRINYSFRFFNNHDLFIYIMSMKDKSINSLVAKFCYDILKIFDQL